MTDTNSPLGEDSRNPNFLQVVLLALAALIVVLVCAYFLVGDKGRKLLPGKQKDLHPTSLFREGHATPSIG